jgi:hypothetical protein
MLCEAEGITWEITLPLPDALTAAEAALVRSQRSGSLRAPEVIPTLF